MSWTHSTFVVDILEQPTADWTVAPSVGGNPSYPVTQNSLRDVGTRKWPIYQAVVRGTRRQLSRNAT